MITGHSLGAGTAAILTLLLRAAFPRVCCYTFGTPGSVLDRRTSEGALAFLFIQCMNTLLFLSSGLCFSCYFSTWCCVAVLDLSLLLLSTEYAHCITSVVLSNDIVPRLNFTSICVLRNEILDAICRAKVSKMLVMQAIFREFDNDELMYPPGEEPDSEFKRSIVKYKVRLD